MLHISFVSPFCHSKFDVALKITIVSKSNSGRVMLHISFVSPFCPTKIDVTLKITIEFMIDRYSILI
jgi:hypothetical protein